MAALWGAFRQVTTHVLRQPLSTTYGACHHVTSKVTSLIPSSVQLLTSRLSSSYNAYPKFQETPDPFTSKKLIRHGYKYKYYKGGLLPRPKGEMENQPLPFPKVYPQDRDQWTKKKALFGQNDYIDILGDGTVHPAQLMDGPKWLWGFKGTEMQRLVRRMKFQGHLLKNVFPTKYNSIRKRIWFLYKKDNRRKHASFWSGKGAGRRNRRIHFNKF